MRCQQSWANVFKSKNENTDCLVTWKDCMSFWDQMCFSQDIVHTNPSRAFLLRWPGKPYICLNTRMNNYVTTRYPSLLFLWDMKVHASLHFPWLFRVTSFTQYFQYSRKPFKSLILQPVSNLQVLLTTAQGKFIISNPDLCYPGIKG